MDKEKLTIKILNKKLNGLDKTLKDQADTINSAKKQPDDEWSVDGDPDIGRKNKESIIEGCSYTVGYINAVKNLIPEFIDLLKMDENEIAQLIKENEQVDKQNKKHFEKVRKELSLRKARTNKTGPHIDWCNISGTGRPWAIDEECNCPGAYIIRKRMKEGMSFEQAKQYVIDNHLL